MSKFLHSILCMTTLILFGMGVVSCNSPKIIPDDKLAQIFHDAYLTNAYIQLNRPQLDSLNIYEPIFTKYGYTTEDLQFTIGNFAKRKSARLSDVVDRGIDKLEQESRFYQRRIAIYDTIGLIARDLYAQIVYFDTLISVKKISDTSKLRIILPIQGPATYKVAYTYLIDSIDLNNNLRVVKYLLDSQNRHSNNNTRRLKKLDRELVTATFNAEENHVKLLLNFNNYEKGMKRPAMRIDSLVVTRFLPDREARRLMGQSWFDYSAIDTLTNPPYNPALDTIPYIFTPDEWTIAKDSIALPAHPPRSSAR